MFWGFGTMKKLLLCSLLMIGFFANSNSNANETSKLVFGETEIFFVDYYDVLDLSPYESDEKTLEKLTAIEGELNRRILTRNSEAAGEPFGEAFEKARPLAVGLTLYERIKTVLTTESLRKEYDVVQQKEGAAPFVFDFDFDEAFLLEGLVNELIRTAERLEHERCEYLEPDRL
jgi:hypothetical protein